MEVSTVFYICTYCVFTWYGRVNKVGTGEWDGRGKHALLYNTTWCKLTSCTLKHMAWRGKQTLTYIKMIGKTSNQDPHFTSLFTEPYNANSSKVLKIWHSVIFCWLILKTPFQSRVFSSGESNRSQDPLQFCYSIHITRLRLYLEVGA